jgi:lipoate-protein ligase A
MFPCRLLVDDAQRGAWNMAIDDVLLSSAANDNVATLRFYGWSEPTLSLGYFQPLAARDGHEPSRNCAIVRRASGGGAILHDRELTYSLALPASALMMGEGGPRSHTDLYRIVHESLIAALAELGVTGAHRYGASPAIASAAHGEPGPAEPFLCFERRTEHDVILQGAKIAGSAQRKRTSANGNSAILQHGSILLARSPAAPSLAGINELAKESIVRPIARNTLIAAWEPLLVDALGLWPESQAPRAQESTDAGAVEKEKFGNRAWLTRR